MRIINREKLTSLRVVVLYTNGVSLAASYILRSAAAYMHWINFTSSKVTYKLQSNSSLLMRCQTLLQCRRARADVRYETVSIWLGLVRDGPDWDDGIQQNEVPTAHCLYSAMHHMHITSQSEH